MGHSARSLMSVGPRPLLAAGPGWSVALSGADLLDTNLALLATDDADQVDHVLGLLSAASVPVPLALAGDAAHVELGSPWILGGQMPFMALDLSSRPVSRDARVRLVEPASADEAATVICDAFGLGDDARFIGELARRDDVSAELWCLVDESRVVCAVVADVVDDAVCIWCMATPAASQRRGYGRALLGDVLARAAARGATTALLGATEAGRPLYDAMGFATLEQWGMHVRSAPR